MKALTVVVLVASFFFAPLSSNPSDLYGTGKATQQNHPAQQPQAEVAFRNVDVFDGSRMIRNTTVLVRGGMIRGVGTDVRIPESAQIIDSKGKTLLPGFFDAHTHLGVFNGEQFLKDALSFGVTTELEMWGAPSSQALKTKVSGDPGFADLRTAGTGVTAPKGHPTQMDTGVQIPTLSPGDDVQAFVDARIAEGSDYIKVVYEHAYPTLTRQQIEDVVAAAHRRNKLVVCHVTNQKDARDAIEAGVDGLVHIFSDSLPEPGFAEFAAQYHVFVIATLATIEAIGATGPKSWWHDSPKLTAYLTPSMRRSLEMKYPPRFAEKHKFAHALAATGALHRAGVRILAGTDAPAPGTAHGLSLHRELELLVQSGLSPVEALAAATLQPARAFGFHDRGRVAVGARADLVLVNGDPSKDITATRDIVGIWKFGVAHRRSAATTNLNAREDRVNLPGKMAKNNGKLHVVGGRKETDDEVDELFRMPLAEFTSARNALAARLKKSGRGDDAELVKALTKPPISAWAVNQLYWQHRAAFEKLTDSGERFHKAQSSRSAGKVADLRFALDARREALTQLSDLATSLLESAGHNAAPETIRRITTTLEAISVYASRTDAPRPGRLTHDVDPPGFESLGSFTGAGVTEKPAKPGKATTAQAPSSTVNKTKPLQDARKLEAMRKAKIAAAKVSLQEAKRSLNQARDKEQRLKAAQKKAQTEAHAAEQRLEKAKAASEDATQRARSVGVEVMKATKSVEDAESSVEEASEELEKAFGKL